MNLFAWLVLGFISYVSGFSIRHFGYNKQDVPKDKLWLYTGAFFVASLVVFSVINFWVMGKPNFDIAFIGVSSLVATGVFFYGISTDTNNTMKMPD